MPAVGEVEVWRLKSVDPGLLSKNEQIRASRYVSEQARCNFETGRSGVRAIAAAYLKCGANDLSIGVSPDGKPFLEGCDSLHFNLTHHQGEVFASFSGEPTGIDLENPSRRVDWAAISHRYFQPSENQMLSAGGEAGRQLFFQIWTAKEAMLKLSGEGLAQGLSRVRYVNESTGFIGERRVFLAPFQTEGLVGTISSWTDFQVKGWFDL